MLSPPDSIAILQLLLRLTSAKTAVEVGCFTGTLWAFPPPSEALMLHTDVLVKLHRNLRRLYCSWPCPGSS